MHLIMKYAYIDEYGAYGFKFSDLGCTAHYMDTLLNIAKGGIIRKTIFWPFLLFRHV